MNVLLEEVGLTGGGRTPSASLRSAPPAEGEETGEVGLTGGSVFQRVGEPSVDDADHAWRTNPWGVPPFTPELLVENPIRRGGSGRRSRILAVRRGLAEGVNAGSQREGHRLGLPVRR